MVDLSSASVSYARLQPHCRASLHAFIALSRPQARLKLVESFLRSLDETWRLRRSVALLQANCLPDGTKRDWFSN